MNTARFMDQAYDAVAPVNGYKWQFLVLTSQGFDPTNPDHVTAEFIRERIFLMQKLAKGAWAFLKAPGAAMLRTTEISQRGMVHANLIYYGPTIDKRKLNAALAAVDCRAGTERAMSVENLDYDPVPGQPGKRTISKDPRGSKSALKRAGKYAAKGIAAQKPGKTKPVEHPGEGWLGGEDAVLVIDPRLAARWEIACYRLQLSQRYGALRKLKFDEDAPQVPADDSSTKCSRCGSMGHWHWSHRNAERWIQECHALGEPALQGSDWQQSRAGPSEFD
jgi:hypothetical protein